MFCVFFNTVGELLGSVKGKMQSQRNLTQRRKKMTASKREDEDGTRRSGRENLTDRHRRCKYTFLRVFYRFSPESNHKYVNESGLTYHIADILTQIYTDRCVEAGRRGCVYISNLR